MLLGRRISAVIPEDLNLLGSDEKTTIANEIATLCQELRLQLAAQGLFRDPIRYPSVTIKLSGGRFVNLTMQERARDLTTTDRKPPEISRLSIDIESICRELRKKLTVLGFPSGKFDYPVRIIFSSDGELIEVKTQERKRRK